MPGRTEVRVKGAPELEAAFMQVRRDVLIGLKPELVGLGERVKADAQDRAPSDITNVGSRWSQFRIGVALKEPLVYVAPRFKRRGGSPRPGLAPQLGEVMREALEAHEETIVAGLDALVDGASLKAGL